MHVLRRLVLVVAVCALGGIGVVGPAMAQYPGGTGIACNTSTVLAGEAFTCQAEGFAPRTPVTVTATGDTTGASTTRSATAAGQWTFETTVTSNAAGVARATIQTPDNATGSTLVRFAGTDPQGGARVLSNANAVTVSQPGSGDGVANPAPAPEDGAPAAGPAADAATDDLPITGSDLAFWLGVVGVLVVLGGTLVAVARRRRHRAEA